MKTYTLRLSDEGQSVGETVIHASSMGEAERKAADWARAGEWVDEREVTVHILDAHGNGTPRRIAVGVSP